MFGRKRERERERIEKFDMREASGRLDWSEILFLWAKNDHVIKC